MEHLKTASELLSIAQREQGYIKEIPSLREIHERMEAKAMSGETEATFKFTEAEAHPFTFANWVANEEEIVKGLRDKGFILHEVELSQGNGYDFAVLTVSCDFLGDIGEAIRNAVRNGVNNS